MMIYVIGAGYMAREYCRVLTALHQEILVVGRREEAAKQLRNDLGVEAVSGGISNRLQTSKVVPDAAIVCTPVETLSEIALQLLDHGVKIILVEKPGALDVEELRRLSESAKGNDATVLIAYNRRFYQSTIALEKNLAGEELIAVNFEMTEWSHVIANEPCAEAVLQRWVLANTSHVIDLVCHIAGEFKHLDCYTSGTLPWHSSAARFVGSGISERDILISYCGYWDGPGRWSAEFVTTENRYVLRPMEILQVQPVGSVEIRAVDNIDYSIDEQFKPGIYRQVEAFLKTDYRKFCTLEEQVRNFGSYEKIAGYIETGVSRSS